MWNVDSIPHPTFHISEFWNGNVEFRLDTGCCLELLFVCGLGRLAIDIGSLCVVTPLVWIKSAHFVHPTTQPLTQKNQSTPTQLSSVQPRVRADNKGHVFVNAILGVLT